MGEAGRVRWDQILPPCAKWATFRRLHSRHITCLALLHPLLGMQTMTISVVVGILEVYHPPTPLSPPQAHLAQTTCRIETSERPLAYNLKDESDQNPYHILFQQIEANAETRDDGPPKIIFSIYRPTVLKSESSPPLLHTPKFLAHDEKHTQVPVLRCRFAEL